jgi:two-component system chemotaxis response regulator CheY
MAKILVVDDQESILKTAEALLKKAGHEVETAADGYIALDMLALWSCDLLITDANMPGISGFDLVRSLRMNEKTRHLPILMLTSRQEKRDVERAIQLKVDDYVIKPIDPATLLGKVEVLLVKASAAPAAPEVPTAEAGDLRLAVKVTAVTEEGLSLVCSQNLAAGAVIPVNSPLFAKIGIAPQEVRVIGSQAQGGGWVVIAHFIALEPADRTKLRDWITQNMKPKAS